MKLAYNLSKEHIFEYQFLMAYRNKKLHNTNIKLMVSLVLFVALIGIFILDRNWFTIGATIAVAILIVILFPKYYWGRIEKRIRETLNKEKLVFTEVTLNLNERLEIDYQNKTMSVSLDQIKEVLFTNSVCILQVETNHRIEAILIPIDAIGTHMDEFVSRIRRKDNE